MLKINLRVVRTVLTDLSKAYHCLTHYPFIAKHTAYGFGNTALALITIILQTAFNG